MKRKLIIIAALIWLCLFPAQAAVAQTLPAKPATFLLDNAQALSSETKQQVETDLEGLKTRTGEQLWFLLVKSTDHVDIDDYAQQVYAHWGLNQQAKSSLVVLATKDATARFETENSSMLASDQINSSVDAQITQRLVASDPNEAVLASENSIRSMLGDTQGSTMTALYVDTGGSGGFPWMFLVIAFVVIVAGWVAWRYFHLSVPAIDYSTDGGWKKPSGNYGGASGGVGGGGASGDW